MTRKSSSFILRVTLSGSFHRDPEGLDRSYRELARNQCQILSPRSLTFQDDGALFVKHALEAEESAGTIQRHHLQAIALSDFLWLHAPEGYIGTSAAMEIGYAYRNGTPIFSNQVPVDEMLKHFVTFVPSVFAAIELLQT
ncbi:MAG TPA: hypothetical protein VIM31_02445 [Candidatus Microsaccharimonas sp.]|jgi:hypothetical protein